MIYYIKSENVDELFVKTARKLLENGKYTSPRGKMTLELQNVWLELAYPQLCILSLPSRKFNLDYLKGELEWYNSGSLDVKDIAKYSKFWEKLADSNGTVNSNYGFIINKDKFNGISQFEWCLNKLKSDKHTRQAIMNYNQPKHKYNDNKDFVCTISQQFILNDNSLDSIVLMRSNDFIYGLSYDLPWFTSQQLKLCEELELNVGKYMHYATSLHVYKKHFNMLKNISQDNY